MRYTLAYSFNDDPGMIIAPHYIGSTGIVGDEVPSTGDFEISGWYGWTLQIDVDYRGFIGFIRNDGMVRVMFAVNPEEGQNNDMPSSLTRTIGPGGYPYTTTVEDTSGNPIAGVKVWLTTDPNGKNSVAGTLNTDSTGQATFVVPQGVYYMWRVQGGYYFPNPKQIQVPG